MKPRRRTSKLVRFVSIALLFLFMPILVLGATVAATGTISVAVHDEAEGLDLWIPVPALLVDVAAVVAPLAIPREALAEIRSELGPYRQGLENLARELESCPDGVLVHVDSRDENVRVVKRGRRLTIEVDSQETQVRVSVPARIVSRALGIVA